MSLQTLPGAAQGLNDPEVAVSGWVWCANEDCDTAFDPGDTERTLCRNCQKASSVRTTRACADCRRMFHPARPSHAACLTCRRQRAIDERDSFKPRATVACATCVHGVREPRSDSGWMCAASLARTCTPWIHARHHEPRPGA